MRFLSKISETINISIKQSLTYVAFSWASIGVVIIQIAVFYYIWMAIYDDSSSMHGFAKTHMVTYIILSRLLLSLVVWGSTSIAIRNLIRSGEILPELSKPFDFQLSFYSIRIGNFLITVFIRTIPVLIFSTLLFGISAPSSLLNFILFIVSLLMSITITFFIDFIVGSAAFYTYSIWGLNNLKEVLITFLSGAMIPLAFLPEWLKQIVLMLPFKDIIYTPVSIYLGTLSGTKLFESLLFEFVWVLIFFAISRFFFYFSAKKVTVQGG